MADNFISGIGGYVKLGAVAYQFSSWKFPISANNKKFFAFGSRSQRTLPGGIAGTITCEGFYDAGNMPLVVGNLYEVHLGYAPGIELVVNARAGDTEFGNEMKTGDDPGGTISVQFDSHGDFTISFA